MIVEAQPPLVEVLHSVVGVSDIISRNDPLPAVDVHSPLLRLPGLLKTSLANIPVDVPYIHPNPLLVEQWRERVSPHVGFKVGIAWRGRIGHRQNRQRSATLPLFSPLANLADVRLFRLQIRDGQEREDESSVDFPLIDLTGEIRDFGDTAALMQNLDLIVSVDTSIVHLAGAIARPVWTLLSHTADFRWMVKRDDSPWYPTMRLFRQQALGEWGPVFERVLRELQDVTRSTKTV